MTAALTRADPAGAIRVRARRIVPCEAIAAGLALVGALAWVLAPAYGTDLAAQVQWAVDVGRHPGALVDFSWYGGVYPMAYSVLAPYLFWLLGARVTAALATVAAAVLGAHLLGRYRRRSAAAATWWTLALLANLLAGRATFALGTAIGTVAVGLALSGRSPGRAAAAGVVALAACLASPVAGVFLGVVAVAFWVAGRRAVAAGLFAGAALPLLGVLLAFGASGVQPITIDVAISPLVAAAIVAALTPRRPVRVAALVYAAGVLVTWLVPNPLGSNVERLGLLACAPLLLATVRRGRWLAAVLPLLAAWLLHVPVSVLAAGADPMARPAYSSGVVAALGRLDAGDGLVEAVPERDHWETVRLAGHVALARGWERQVDVAQNPLFYRGQLTPAAYHHWLLQRGVHYVALSDRPPDWAAVAEARIVRSRPAWLQPVWSGPHWQVFRVVDARPLASGPVSDVAVQPDRVTVTVTAPGSVVLRLPWSRWLRVTGGAGCLAPVPGDASAMVLRVQAPGRYVVGSRIGWPGSACA